MKNAGKLWVSTDLDGSLLDENYRWDPARPALSRLKEMGIPVILNSSKTFSELKFIAENLEIHYPLICENGGVVAIPESSPLAEGLASDRCAGYWLLYPGLHRDHLIEAAHSLREKEKYRFKGFADWDADVVMRYTGLSQVDAARAKCRFATEPIVWNDSFERKQEFAAALAKQGIRISDGGRFSHIMGEVSKGDSMRYVLDMYARAFPDQRWTVMALGDSDNDLEMLSAAEIAGVIPNSVGKRLEPAAPRVINARFQGPAGWNEIVEFVLDEECA